ncbi:MAG: L,D-transpeptidase family protein [Candidatus Promineifilaceae bacterium]|nr:L,D-transpeptidase family protein [Candidatus Promineifilaceae bacterium]
MQTANQLKQAKLAIREGHISEARRLIRQVIREEPQNYVAWLLLARVTDSPQAAQEYVKRAATIRPDNPLVHSEIKRLDKASVAAKSSASRPHWRSAFLLLGFFIAFLLIVIWLAPLGWDRVVALKDSQSALSIALLPTATPWPTRDRTDEAVIDKPTLEPTPTLVPTVVSMITPTATVDVQKALAATIEAGSLIVENPTLAVTETIVESSEESTPQDDRSESAAVVSDLNETAVETNIAEAADIAEPVSTELKSAVQSPGIRPSGVGPNERWIDVNLNTQTLVAYEGDVPVFNSLISSGLWNTPTVTGQFRTWMKYESQDMNGYLLGYDYYLEDVPYVMYFFKDFAIHGAYWHNNFGTPMSHGCVNMHPADAGWLFNWAPVGTTVNIH